MTRCPKGITLACGRGRPLLEDQVHERVAARGAQADDVAFHHRLPSGLHIVDFGREQGSTCLEAHLDFDNLPRSQAGKIVSRADGAGVTVGGAAVHVDGKGSAIAGLERESIWMVVELRFGLSRSNCRGPRWAPPMEVAATAKS